MMRFRVRFHGLALAVVLAAGALAAGRAGAADPTPIPPAPTAFVTDHAGLMSPGGAAQLSRQLEDYERGTGHQVIVWIDRTTGGVPIEDWAVKAFAAWGVGRKSENDGAALFMEPLGHNPFINAYRRCTPKLRTSDEHPLLMSDLELGREYFRTVDARYFHLAALLGIALHRTRAFAPTMRLLDAVDGALVRALPWLRRFAWVTILALEP